MDFDDLLTFLSEHRGATVEISVGLRDGPDGNGTIAGFSGRISSLTKSGARGRGHRWNLRLMSEAVLPEHGLLVLDRSRFRSASVTAEPSSEPEERADSGTLWSLEIEEDDLRTEILFYV